MKNCELNWKQDAADEHHDTPTLKWFMSYGCIINFPSVAHQMNQEVGSKECPQHDKSWMILFHLFDLNLTCIQIVQEAEYECHCENTNTHLEWIHEGDEAEDSQS